MHHSPLHAICMRLLMGWPSHSHHLSALFKCFWYTNSRSPLANQYILRPISRQRRCRIEGTPERVGDVRSVRITNMVSVWWNRVYVNKRLMRVRHQHANLPLSLVDAHQTKLNIPLIRQEFLCFFFFLLFYYSLRRTIKSPIGNDSSLHYLF